MQKRIAILLNGEIKNDYRVIKTIETLSKHHFIDVYYVNGNSKVDQKIFNNNVVLNCFNHFSTCKVRFLQHSFFCYEFSFFQREVLKSNIKYDIVWANDLPTLYPAYKVSKKLGCRLIFDSHEIYTETINQFFPRNATGIRKILFSFIIKLMRRHGERIERKLFSSIHTFITVNQSLLNYFQTNYPVKNGVVLMNVPKLSKNTSHDLVNYNKLFTWDEKSKIIIYQGYLNEGRGIQYFVEIMKNLPHYFKMVIIGSGPLKKDLQNEVNKFSLENRIRLIDTVPLNELSNYTRGAHLGINLLESFNLSKQLASPNKLFEYIHAGIPVIATNTIENAKVLKKFNVGKLTINDSEVIANHIKNLFKEKNDQYSLGLFSSKEYYNWGKQEELLLSILK